MGLVDYVYNLVDRTLNYVSMRSSLCRGMRAYISNLEGHVEELERGKKLAEELYESEYQHRKMLQIRLELTDREIEGLLERERPSVSSFVPDCTII